MAWAWLKTADSWGDLQKISRREFGLRGRDSQDAGWVGFSLAADVGGEG
jgi:hypothetical protein